jgi:hypothetical protein
MEVRIQVGQQVGGCLKSRDTLFLYIGGYLAYCTGYKDDDYSKSMIGGVGVRGGF